MTGAKPVCHTVLALSLGLGLAGPAAAVPPGAPAATEALAKCARADALSGDARAAALAEVKAAAEQVLAAHDDDALAHFALFCAVGKEMKDAGIGLGQLMTVRRLKRELDRTLELAPDDGDALAAKGALLLSLPRLLGGDSEEAERLLRRALVVDPRNTDAKCYLRRALDARGVSDDSLALEPSC